MIVDGIAYTFGVFLPEFVDYFGEGKGKVAWVGSCLSGVYLSAGKVNNLINAIYFNHIKLSTIQCNSMNDARPSFIFCNCLRKTPEKNNNRESHL